MDRRLRLLVANNGGAGDEGLSFDLPLADAGNGAVNTAPRKANGSAMATFTRATTAKTLNSTGTQVSVSSGVARSVYNFSTLAYLGYLAEGARTNICLRSEAFDNASWTKDANTVTVSADTTVAPDGTTTADTITATAGTANHWLYQSVSLTNPNACTVYAKKGTASWIALGHGGSPASIGAYFDLNNGVVGTVNGSGTSATITALPNGWYRCEFRRTNTGSFFSISVHTSDNQALNWNAAGTETVIIWGAQAENASFASSYIPTTSASVTRNADVDQYVSAGNLQTAMTIALDWTPRAAGMGTVFLFGTYVDSDNYTAILHDGTNVVARKRISGANHDATKALTYTANTKYRIAARFDANNGVDVWVDGTKGTGDNTTTASQIGTNFQIGADGNGANVAFSALGRFAVYGRALSDARAATL